MRTATDIPVVLAIVVAAVSVHPWHCHAWTPSLSLSSSLSSSPLPQHYYSTGIRHTRVVPQHQSKPRSHWHRRREWARSAQNDDDEEEEPIEEESSFNIDGYGVTTKTRKQLIFDEATGRFFETSLEPPEQEEIVTSSYTSDYVDDLSSMNRNVIIDYDTTKYAVTDMIPTEELFASRRQLQQQQTPPPPPPSSSSSSSRPPTTSSCTTTSDVLEMECQKQECEIIVVKEEVDDDDDDEQLDDASLLVGVGRVDSVIRDCYDAWNRRDMVAATDCFDDQGFSYQDGQYLGSIAKKEELERHFTLQAGMLPLNSQLVVDQIAVDPTSGNIGTQWHVENSDGASTVSYTKGISFYTTNTQTGKIVSGFRVSEMLVKPSKQASDALVSSVARFLQTPPSSDPAVASFASNKASPSSPPPPLPPPQKSIIETYFEAWNRRDMESALDCFVENCVYQTEDPVFADTFQGKAALRKHLEQNANTLPASCRIVLDGIAMDPTNGTIGTTWHLKVGGVPIPNLRGCSMYTIDAATGLLTSGLDITEAPVKIPRMAMSVLSFPAKWFLFGTPSSFL